MSLYRPIKRVAVSEQPLRLWETGLTHKEFQPLWLADAPSARIERRFPRSWPEVESLIKSRLAQFEQRHQAECEEAFERGLNEGLRRQEEAVVRKLTAARDPLSHVAAAVETELAGQRAAFYQQVTRLASALGESWLRQVVTLNPTTFLAALKDALEPLDHLDDITVRLNPADYRALAEGIATGSEEFLEFAHLQITADPAVDAGGAVAESAGGSVDCRLETRIRQALQIIAAENHASRDD